MMEHDIGEDRIVSGVLKHIIILKSNKINNYKRGIDKHIDVEERGLE